MLCMHKAAASPSCRPPAGSCTLQQSIPTPHLLHNSETGAQARRGDSRKGDVARECRNWHAAFSTSSPSTTGQPALSVCGSPRCLAPPAAPVRPSTRHSHPRPTTYKQKRDITRKVRWIDPLQSKRACGTALESAEQGAENVLRCIRRFGS